MLPGTRVVRLRNWQYAAEDGGEGNLGTLSLITENELTVHWDVGKTSRVCKREKNGLYDLLAYDTGPAGVQHIGYTCRCGDCRSGQDVSNIFGMMWVCGSCSDWRLCTHCYMNSRDIDKGHKDGQNHQFIRVDFPFSAGIQVPKRADTVTADRPKLLGITANVQVQPGPDWKYGAQNNNAVGRVTAMRPVYKNSARSMAEVFWGTQAQTQLYRVGYEGCVDLVALRCMQIGFYFINHLPQFGRGEYIVGGCPQSLLSLHLPLAAPLEKYDLVKLVDSVQTLQGVQAMVAGPTVVIDDGWKEAVAQFAGRTGYVERVEPNGVLMIQFSADLGFDCWQFHQRLIRKLDTPKRNPIPFKQRQTRTVEIGDEVIILEPSLVEEIQKEKGLNMNSELTKRLKSSANRKGIIRLIDEKVEGRVTVQLLDIDKVVSLHQDCVDGMLRNADLQKFKAKLNGDLPQASCSRTVSPTCAVSSDQTDRGEGEVVLTASQAVSSSTTANVCINQPHPSAVATTAQFVPSTVSAGSPFFSQQTVNTPMTSAFQQQVSQMQMQAALQLQAISLAGNSGMQQPSVFATHAQPQYGQGPPHCMFNPAMAYNGFGPYYQQYPYPMAVPPPYGLPYGFYPPQDQFGHLPAVNSLPNLQPQTELSQPPQVTTSQQQPLHAHSSVLAKSADAVTDISADTSSDSGIDMTQTTAVSSVQQKVLKEPLPSNGRSSPQTHHADDLSESERGELFNSLIGGINRQDKFGLSPLTQHMELLDCVMRNGHTLLTYAIYRSSNMHFEQLCSMGASPAVLTGRGTALHWAVASGIFEFVRDLFALTNFPIKDYINVQSPVDGKSALHVAIENSYEDDGLQVLDLLLSCDDLDFTFADHRGHNVLHSAVHLGSEVLVEKILEKVPSLINSLTADQHGYTPLHICLLEAPANMSMLTKLLTMGAEVNRKSGDGRSLLHLAVEKQQPPELIELLATNPVIDLNIADNNMNTVLHLLAEMLENDGLYLHKELYDEASTELNELRIPLEKKDLKMQAVLAAAKGLKTLAITAFLIFLEADVTARDGRNQTVLRILKRGNQAVKESLRRIRNHCFGPCKLCKCEFVEISFSPCGCRLICRKCCTKVPLPECIGCHATIAIKTDIAKNKPFEPEPEVPVPPTAPPTATGLEPDRGVCQICIENDIDSFFMCGHMCCKSCYERLGENLIDETSPHTGNGCNNRRCRFFRIRNSKGKLCPTCRKHICVPPMPAYL